MTDHTKEEKKESQKPRSWLERMSALLAREPRDREQLTELLHAAEERNIMSTDMLAMIERILQVSEMQVREVTVPKAQMVVVRKDAPYQDVLRLVTESGHSRFPVMDIADKEVIGILLAKDLLKFSFTKNPNEFDIKTMMRPAVFSPLSKRLDILLREFRVNRNHIAIVLDEYGHVAGLVTIEDVLEQIVGDIEDEYDIDEDDTHIKKLEDGTCIVKASTLIDEFNEYFHTDFSDEEFDTIGGIVLQAFGHMPKRDETIKIKNLRFKILHGDNRRIYLLEVKAPKSKK